MRISRVKVSNYRNLKKVDVELGNIVTLVGENNSGKSNFLKAISIPLSSENGGSKRLSWYDIQVSMDGVGRCKDNIFVERTWRTLKYEWVFLKDYRFLEDLERGLSEFVGFFNNKRIHQSLDYKTPEEVYKEGTFPNINKDIEVA